MQLYTQAAWQRCCAAHSATRVRQRKKQGHAVPKGIGHSCCQLLECVHPPTMMACAAEASQLYLPHPHNIACTPVELLGPSRPPHDVEQYLVLPRSELHFANDATIHMHDHMTTAPGCSPAAHHFGSAVHCSRPAITRCGTQQAWPQSSLACTDCRAHA